MSTASDQWAWYKAAIAGQSPPISPDIVESGFYYSKASKEGGRVPVAIWRGPDGAFNCRVGTKAKPRNIDVEEAAKKWTYVAGNPVSRDDYKVAYETGTWPDGTPTVAPEAAKAGSNLPADPFERVKAEIADKMASAEAFLKAHSEVKTQVDADRARHLQAEILALNKQADAMHKAEKAPILAAEAAVEDKFRFRKAAKGFADQLRTLFERFAVKEEDRLRKESQAKFEAERRATELARQEAEKARAKLMRDDPIQALTTPDPELPEMPTAPAPVKVNVGGGIGRAAGLKSVWVGRIENYDLALQHFKNAPDIKDALEKLVNAVVRAQKGAADIPGVKVSEERRAA